jgi:LexA-binding, inner membrane-associated putative hydrolase
MHVGHFAAGLIGKPLEPKLSVGTLVLASMLADLLWCVFTLAGIEEVRFGTGLGAANYFQAINIALSHSLVMLVVWGVVFAGVYFLVRRNLRGAVLLFCLVVSHWLLDVIAHKPDMPLFPGGAQRLGFGLWTSIPATIIVEGGLWVIAIVLYLRATPPKGRLAFFVFWPVVLLLTLFWYSNIAGPPPPNPAIAPIFSLIYFSLVVAWSYWINRLRPTS